MGLHLTEPPKPRVAVVKASPDEEVYDVYLMNPILLGQVIKTKHAEYSTSDGSRGFLNIPAAVAHWLEIRGYPELAKIASNIMTGRKSKSPVISKKLAISGYEMLRMRVWEKFAEANNIDVGSEKALKSKYQLSPAEVVKYGIKPE